MPTSRDTETIAGTIGQSGPAAGAATTLNQYGGGTPILTGNDAVAFGFTGVNVMGGTVLANNTTGSATGTGSVRVTYNATLGGLGTIAGPALIDSRSTLSPGSLGSIGTLTFTGGLTLNPGAFANFTLGRSSDLVAVSGGSLSLSGMVNVVAGDGFGVGTYDLFN